MHIKLMSRLLNAPVCENIELKELRRMTAKKKKIIFIALQNSSCEHFAAVLVLPTMWNELFCSCVNEVCTFRQISITKPRKPITILFQDSWCIFCKPNDFDKWLQKSYIFSWCSSCLRRRPCLSSTVWRLLGNGERYFSNFPSFR